MTKTRVLILGPPGPGRAEIEQATAELGYAVVEALPSEPLTPEADLIALDGRGLGAGAAADVVVDHRPLVGLFDGVTPLATALRSRTAPTMMMADCSPAGLKVALTTCAALRPSLADHPLTKGLAGAS